ncbi:DUF3099 domain-containing protein [Corynebacterium sp.]|uniref:DUF3099 domain-containing protein n=1 Tax=Corynebacterium sp. TaxID=1720 RepID=UPI002A9088E3|nr:DUF3099 domain-containing protein [Corynebacterium sp.]MDY5785966.1 DUF3099 domain-containing protein [Corynebacterium sp.]
MDSAANDRAAGQDARQDAGRGPRPDPVTVDAVVDAAASPTTTGRRIRLRRRRGALITDATRSPEQNLRSRERTYMVLQLLRLPFIVASIVSAWTFDNWWLAGILFVISVPLPWIAVMIGNGQGEKRDPRARNVYKPAVQREHERLEMQRRAELEARPQTAEGTKGSGDAEPGTIIDHDN